MPDLNVTRQPAVEPASLPPAPEWRFLTTAQNDQLAGLVLELAGQLHIERTRLSTMEHLLVSKGFVDRESLDSAAADPVLRKRSGDELDRSLRGLLRVLIEGDDARTPLRPDLDAEV